MSETTETEQRLTEIEIQEQEAELVHLRNHVTPEHKAVLAARDRHAQASLELAEEGLWETRLLALFDVTALKLLKREGEGVRLSPRP